MPIFVFLGRDGLRAVRLDDKVFALISCLSILAVLVIELELDF